MRARPSSGRRPSCGESGVVLITALVFMVVLTLIVLALMRSTTLEERMAANARDRQLALQAAEAVVRDARETLFPPVASPRFGSPIDPFDADGFTAGCTNGLCSPPPLGTPRWKTMSVSSWTAGAAITRSFAVPANSDLAGVASQPRYFVELVGTNPGEDASTQAVAGGQAGGICPPLLFRVTARGVGRVAANVFVESTLEYRPEKFANGSCG